MSVICRVCGSEERYDEHHRLYKPCDSCNNKRALDTTILLNISYFKGRKITIIIMKNSLVNKIENEKVKYLILKTKLKHYLI